MLDDGSVGVAARAVLVTPLSGPLARFGIAGASAVALWADRSGVSLEVIDAYPSAASAIRAAEASRPDVVFGPYGSGPALAAAAVSKGVVWNHGGATARLARPAYPRDDEPPQFLSRIQASPCDDPARQFLPIGYRLDPPLGDEDTDPLVPVDGATDRLIGHRR